MRNALIAEIAMYIDLLSLLLIKYVINSKVVLQFRKIEIFLLY